jgi:hypothetical protein
LSGLLDKHVPGSAISSRAIARFARSHDTPPLDPNFVDRLFWSGLLSSKLVGIGRVGMGKYQRDGLCLFLLKYCCLRRALKSCWRQKQQMIRNPGSKFAFKGPEEGGDRLRCKGNLFLTGLFCSSSDLSFFSFSACPPSLVCTLPRQAIAPPSSSTPFTQQCWCSFYVRCNLDRLCCSRFVAGWPYRSNKHCRQFHIDQFNLYGEILPNQGGLFVTLC